MTIVCGKCGSNNVFGYQGVVPGEGLMEVSLSCMKCGNTTESKKYGFYAVEKGEGMGEKIICKNCNRERSNLGLGLCSTCRKAAGDLQGEAREKALADVKEKILSGKIKTRNPARKVQGKAADTSRVSPVPPPGPPGTAAPALSKAGERRPKFCFEITITNDKDRMLIEKLKIIAREERRTIPMQIISMMEKAMKNISSGETCAEKDAAHA